MFLPSHLNMAMNAMPPCLYVQPMVNTSPWTCLGSMKSQCFHYIVNNVTVDGGMRETVSCCAMEDIFCKMTEAPECHPNFLLGIAHSCQSENDNNNNNKNNTAFLTPCVLLPAFSPTAPENLLATTTKADAAVCARVLLNYSTTNLTTLACAVTHAGPMGRDRTSPRRVRGATAMHAPHTRMRIAYRNSNTTPLQNFSKHRKKTLPHENGRLNYELRWNFLHPTTKTSTLCMTSQFKRENEADKFFLGEPR